VRALLTGNQGYLGSRIEKVLGSRGVEVLGWSREQDVFSLTRDRIQTLGVDCILHFAAVMERNDSVLDLNGPSFQINSAATQHLIDQISGSSVYIIYMSTKDVYGEPFSAEQVVESATKFTLPHSLEESYRVQPITPYAKSKLIGEWFLKKHPLHAVIRLSTCYTDEDFPRGNWILNLIKAKYLQKPITITGKGKQMRDPLHVDDLADLLMKIMITRPERELIHAGGGKANVISILDYLTCIGVTQFNLLDKGPEFGFDLSIERAQSKYEWIPKISVLAAARELNAKMAEKYGKTKNVEQF